jgi:hypothetical protein
MIRKLFDTVLSIAFSMLAQPAFCQRTNVPPLNAPRTSSGEIDLKAPAPRLPDGRPDLSGSWSPDDNRLDQLGRPTTEKVARHRAVPPCRLWAPDHRRDH